MRMCGPDGGISDVLCHGAGSIMRFVSRGALNLGRVRSMEHHEIKSWMFGPIAKPVLNI